MFFAHLHLERSQFMFQPQNLQVDSLSGSNVVVVQRLSSQENLRALKIFRERQLKIIYDLDDDIWSVPPYNPAFKVMKQWIPGYEICSSMADLITVSTQHLRIVIQKALGRKCPPVEVLENAVDFSWFRPLSDKYRRKRNGKLVVGWAGTNTHIGDIDRVIQMMPSVLSENQNVDFEIIGHEPSETLKGYGDRVRERYFVPIAEFGSSWAGWQWDISMAPLAENDFNRSKSNIKLLEAAALKIPCLASNFGEYSKFMNHSIMLKRYCACTTAKEWKSKLTDLIRNDDLRKKVGEEMHRVAMEHYNIYSRTEQWKSIFHGLLS